MEDAILFSKNQAIATLTLNRPQKRNAFDDRTILLFIKYLEQIAANDDIRALIIRGNGPHFCAGADIEWMQKAAGYSFAENKRDAGMLAQLMQVLYKIQKPTITLVQGSIYGGGLGLVACSDIVLALPTAQFCFSEVKLGLVPAVVGPYVIQAMGQRQALPLMLTAEVFSAEKALQLNLIHEILDETQIERRLAELLMKLKANGPVALQRCKEMLHHFNHPKPNEYLEYTTELIARLRASNEAKQGFAAFLEKRKPAWQKDDE